MEKTQHSRIIRCAKRESGMLRRLAALTAALIISGAHMAVGQDTANPFAGLYVGAHGGYSWSDANFTSAPYIANLPFEDVSVSGRNDKFDLDGALIGLHSGFNVVTSGNVLFGIEGDWTHLGNKDTVTGSELVQVNSEDFLFDHRSTLDLEWQGTIRGRLGYVSGNTLFFGTAGIAFLKADWSETATAFDDDAQETYIQIHSDSETLNGFVLGGGIEFAVSQNVILGADYLYENFGSYGSVPFGHATPAQAGSIDDLDVHKVRVRLSIKLGGGE